MDKKVHPCYMIALCAIMKINEVKHRPTLEAILSTSTRGSIMVLDIEALIRAIGGEVREGEGPRVVFEVKGSRK